MAEDPATTDLPRPLPLEDLPVAVSGSISRNEKRKALKKMKRKKIRREAAIRARKEEEARSNDPEEQRRLKLEEEAAAEAAERARREFEVREKLWIEAAAARKKAEEEEEEERRRKEKLLQESSEFDKNQNTELASELEDDEWDYVEEGPAEIIWQGNEIIVKKKRVKVAKRSSDRKPKEEDVDRPTSNPLPPQSAAFASYKNVQSGTAQEALENVAQQVPNFGTEQDKAHCPFHLKTGVCRFGPRCSRVHFYPDKSCIFLIKNMYNGPGLAWEQDEGLEYTDEEVEHSFEEFYEDVHTEFLKFGELVNFKVCKNGSYHLRGNVYVHYKSLESAILAYNNMNGRYFAGKQITCEFIGISRWKVAICGEYMKSRFKTCSHGTACNFMHCFRNPGGDYEWADWDDPPPRHWIKKMAVLFGPDESAHGMKMELKDSERSRSRKKPYFLDRSRSPYEKIEVHDSGSGREDSNRKRDHRSSRKEHSSSNRRRKTFQDKYEQYEEKHNVGLHDRNIKRSHHIHDSGEDCYLEKDTDFLGKHRRVEKGSEDHTRHKKKHRAEDSSVSKKWDAFFDVQEKSERNIKSKSHKHNKIGRLSDQNFDYHDDNGGQSDSHPGDKSYSRRDIVAQDRYNGRSYSTDSDSGGNKKSSPHIKRVHKRKTDLDGRDSFNDSNSGGDEKSSRHIKRAHKRRESGHHNSERTTAKTTFNSEEDNENWKSGKIGFSSDAPPKGRDITDTDLSSEETRDRSLHNGSSRSSKKHKSGRKRKHQKGKEETGCL